MARKKLRIGAHMSIAGGLENALYAGAKYGCEVIQLFTKSNQQWAAKPITEADRQRWQSALLETEVEPVLAHASYLVNLASPLQEVWGKSLRSLREEMDRCRLLDIPYLVVHPGAHMEAGEEKGIGRVVRAVDRLLEQTEETTLLLENTAGQGTCLGHRFEHLRDILGGLQAPDRVGICLDTCHALAAGYDLTTQAGWDETFTALKRTVGTKYLKAFHVNDSKTAKSSRVDRHDHLGHGFVGLSAFKRLVNDFAPLPMVLETPKPTKHSDAINLAILRSLFGKQRVTPRATRLSQQSHKKPPRK